MHGITLDPHERSRVVAESWARAAAADLVPDRITIRAELAGDELEEARRRSSLASMMPVIRALLIAPAAADGGLVVTVADAAGRLLWVEGDRRVAGGAADAGVVPGADWSESRAGLNATGTALALDRRVQVAGEEHFAVQAQSVCCTAVPIRDLATAETIGVLDVTGGPEAVGEHALPLVAATAAAAERELQLQRLGHRAEAPLPRATGRTRLAVLGQERAVLSVGGRAVPLSLRHAEVLLLLAWHGGGLTAERLAELVHGRPDATAVRPEMTRLRRLLTGIAPDLVPLGRPYRLPAPLDTDARRLVGRLDRGAHRSALDAYVGAVLPASVAPGVVAIRAEVDARLRESLLQSASPALLLQYADAVAPRDPEPLLTALRLLPERSPRRAAVAERLRALG